MLCFSRSLNRVVWLVVGLAALVVFAGCKCCQPCKSKDPAAVRADSLRGLRATYCGGLRKPDGRLDVDGLIAQLVEIHANTYSYCIHGNTNDWADLAIFLPRARAHGIKVWASVVPPSESPPKAKTYAEPFRLDYHRWAVEFAKLSVKEPNLVAWSIDDFTHNLSFYTTAYVEKMMADSRAINPKLAFAPCCYYTATTEAFTTNYCHLIDGILFPYRHESKGANLKEPDLVIPEIQHLKSLTGPNFPIVLDIYATAHSRLGATTPEYVEAAMIDGHKATDSIMIYRHQDPIKDSAKYQIVKRLFTEWAAESKKAP